MRVRRTSVATGLKMNHRKAKKNTVRALFTGVMLLVTTLLLSGNGARADYDFSDRFLTFPIGSFRAAAAIGDLNSDGRQDIAVVTGLSNNPDNCSNCFDFRLLVFLQNEWGQLDSPIMYKTSALPGVPSVAIGDLNHDGKADVVLGYGNNIEVFLQTASGTLGPSTVYASTNGGAVRVLDLNNDGLLDVITMGREAIDIFLQNASGTLNQSITLTIPQLMNFAIGDVNGDGLKDIVLNRSVAGRGNGTMEVMFQAKDGTFADPKLCYTMSGDAVFASFIAVDDVNGDGLKDVVAASQVSVVVGEFTEWKYRIFVFYQNQGGTFDPPIVIDPNVVRAYGLSGLAITDVNGDGRNDVVLLDGPGACFLVLRQDSSGKLSADPDKYGENDDLNSTLAFGDVNGDGLPDAVLTGDNNGLIIFYHAPPTPIVDARPFPVNMTSTVGAKVTQLVAVINYGAREMKVGQIAIDGVNSDQFSIGGDVCSNQPLPSLYYCQLQVLFQPSSTGMKKAFVTVPSNDPLRPAMKIPLYGNVPFHDLFHPWAAFDTGSSPAQAVAVGDLNGDGRNDIVLTTSMERGDAENDHRLFIFSQDLSGWLLPPARYPLQQPYGYPYSLSIGDVNGDGRPDVVVGKMGSAMEVFPQSGTGSLSPSTLYSSMNSNGVAIGDFNNDGLLDVARSVLTDRLSDGLADRSNPYCRVDVFLQDQVVHELGAPAAYYVPNTYGQIMSGDMNGDGLTDLVVLSGLSSAPDISVLTQKKDGTFAKPRYYLGDYWKPLAAAVGDVNGDGLQDIVYASSDYPVVGVLLQKPDGSMAPEVTYDAAASPHAISIADVNGDGRQDVIVTHRNRPYVGVFLQDTDGTLMPEELYESPYCSQMQPGGNAVGGLAVADVNGDGLPDIAMANEFYGLVMLYHKGPGPVPPPPTLTVTIQGTGQGTVWGSGWSITSGSHTESFHFGASYSETHTAAANTGSVFAGWSGGGCSGTGPCSVAGSSSTSVTATFTKVTPPNPCTYTISPPGKHSFTWRGGSLNVSVTASGSTSCSSPDISSDQWITATLISFKNNNGSLRVIVPLNNTISTLNGSVRIADKTFSVTQAGAPCTLKISPVDHTPSASGGSSSFTVTTPTGCAWSAEVASGSEWLTIASGSSGTGSGTVTYDMGENTGKTARRGSIHVSLVETPRKNKTIIFIQARQNTRS